MPEPDPLDPNMRLAFGLVAAQDWRLLKWFTGIDIQSTGQRRLPMFLETTPPGGAFHPSDLRVLATTLGKLGLKIPLTYLRSLGSGSALWPARLAVRHEDLVDNTLPDSIAAILDFTWSGKKFFKRASVPSTHNPCLDQSLRDLGFPAAGGYIKREYKGATLMGKDIVVGIIDDGCAFADVDFLDGYSTRILSLWDQSQEWTGADAAVGWTQAEMGYGRDIQGAEIDSAINRYKQPDGTIDEDGVYEYLDYEVGAPGDLAVHGTHVMSIAAGNGRSMMGWEGVAPKADIIFVQLPRAKVDRSDPNAAGLSNDIAAGVRYIFEQSERLGRKACVVNISYGGYRGSHDGTSECEKLIDAELVRADGTAVANRAVVVSAGNGFEEQCHARVTVQQGLPKSLGWIIKGQDPTPNQVDLWYNAGAAVDIGLIAPDGTAFGPYPIVRPPQQVAIQRPSDGRIIGWIDHSDVQAGNLDTEALITLRPTEDEPYDPAVPPSNTAPAPPGTWTIRLSHAGGADADVHAWIQRDDGGRGRSGRRQQSRFVDGLADPKYTLGDLSTGKHTICVGAYNTGTQQVARYSACGPTRKNGADGERKKPETCAPGAEDAAGRGVLSASSRRAYPTRMNGTSASAPHVTGLVALMLEYAVKHAGGSIKADDIRTNLTGHPVRLQESRHQLADAHVQTKQGAVWADLVGCGKIDFARTMQKLFP